MDIKASRNADGARVLVVADWTVDPHGVIAACRERSTHGPTTFALVVPAWLHGLNWVGDPYASRPCAARQLETLERIARAAGIVMAFTEVGDPDPTSAIDDARALYAATEILICIRPRRLAHPFSLAGRVRRATRLEVREVGIRRAAHERRGWSLLRSSGQCAPDAPQAA